MSASTRAIDVVRVRAGERFGATDCAAAEEPLEVRLHGRPFAVIMRTPGADRELAAGFLFAERVVTGSDDLGAIQHCTDGESIAPNVINVTLADASRADAAFADKRQVTTSSACGLCGRRTIESLASDVAPLPLAWTIASAVLPPLVDRLRAVQSVFEETGGLHAAGLFTRDGTLLDSAEDVGRHNAVDKLVGRMLIREALPLADCLLVVSGRTSFEIIQKAVFAGIPLVASVSAPSSLAIDLAERMGLTLAGFVRGDAFNLYAHPGRVVA